ncbi:MAG TPA: hypothetical protein VNO52_15820 [Methylomirabilota bacterium]|nr:hypothetical protein [Methylomirabilota bacterium]
MNSVHIRTYLYGETYIARAYLPKGVKAQASCTMSALDAAKACAAKAAAGRSLSNLHYCGEGEYRADYTTEET